MKTLKHILSVGATLIMTASISSVYAEDGNMSETRTQERVRTELNLQLPASEVVQSRNREEHTAMSENKNQYQYKYMNKYQNGNAGSAGDSRKSENAEYNIWQGNTAAGSMNRKNTANRSIGSGRY
jgi:hypothetical protein